MAIDDFYNDPKEFLKTNVVRVGGIPVKSGETTNSVFYLIIRKKEHAKVVDDSGREIGKVYDLARSDGTTGIKAYFCPYKQNSSCFITLGAAANYMFTTQMDGCTFGIGSNAGGNILVGHANYAAIGKEWEQGNSMALDPSGTNSAPSNVAMGRQRQRQSQLNVLQSKMDWKGKFIKPEDYMPADAGRATTFGVRKAGGWSFYTAMYWTTDNWTFQNRGVTTRFKGI